MDQVASDQREPVGSAIGFSLRRPALLTITASVVFIVGVIAAMVLIDAWQTKARLSVEIQGRTYAARIYANRIGYYLKVDGPSHWLSDGLIVTHEALGNQPADCRIEWNQDKQEIVGMVGKFRSTVGLP
jgi:hypothetical protein